MTQTYRSHPQASVGHQGHQTRTTQTQPTTQTKPTNRRSSLRLDRSTLGEVAPDAKTLASPAYSQVEGMWPNRGDSLDIAETREGNGTTQSLARAWGEWVEKTLMKSVEYEELGMEPANAHIHVFAQVSNAFASEVNRMRNQRSPVKLTTKQREALTLLDKDYSSTRIAKLLGVTRN